MPAYLYRTICCAASVGCMTFLLLFVLLDDLETCECPGFRPVHRTHRRL